MVRWQLDSKRLLALLVAMYQWVWLLIQHVQPAVPIIVVRDIRGVVLLRTVYG